MFIFMNKPEMVKLHTGAASRARDSSYFWRISERSVRFPESCCDAGELPPKVSMRCKMLVKGSMLVTCCMQ